MINIIAFLIEHFDNINTCPDNQHLSEILEQAGFEDDDINALLLFINLLHEPPVWQNDDINTHHGVRIYNEDEIEVLATPIRALLHFLETEHAIGAVEREFIVHALMHLPQEYITIDNTKMLASLALWAHNAQLPTLIGQELVSMLYDKNTMH